MKILAIETSCDETAIALVKASGGIKAPRFKVLKNLIASQIEIHRPFGGVVPNLAKREHIKNLPLLLKQLLASSRSKIKDQRSKLGSRNTKYSLLPTHYSLPPIDMIAVTVGPGLEPALSAGIEFAKKLGEKLHVPVIRANYL